MSNCRVIAIVNRKGGVAKTTSTINLGAALVRMGHKVLLVDYDDQCSLTQALGLWPEILPNGDITEHLKRSLEGYNEEPFYGILSHKEGMDLLPGSKFLPEMEKDIYNSDMNPRVVDSYLQQIRHAYDFILFDCPATFNSLLGNILAASDEVVIPVIPETMSAMGLNDMFEVISEIQTEYNPALQINGILVTKASLRYRLTRDINNMLKITYPDVRIFEAIIPSASAVATAPTFGESIFSYEKRSPAANAYERAAKELFENGI